MPAEREPAIEAAAGDGRPVPRPSAISAPFWDGCRAGRLMVQRCEDCGNHVFVPGVVCPACHSRALAWRQSSGKGTIDSYTVVFRPQQPAFEVPYIVAVVRLAEGWYLPTNLVGMAPDEAAVGMAVEVRFEPRDEGIAVPVFGPGSD